MNMVLILYLLWFWLVGKLTFSNLGLVAGYGKRNIEICDVAGYPEFSFWVAFRADGGRMTALKGVLSYLYGMWSDQSRTHSSRLV
jgi:hypothetical protein